MSFFRVILALFCTAVPTITRAFQPPAAHPCHPPIRVSNIPSRLSSPRIITLKADSDSMSTDATDDIIQPTTTTATTTLKQKVINYFKGPQDGLTFKQRLAKMGLAAALSYGWVSNMSYAVSVSCAWFIFSKRNAVSPLAPGQWKGFLAVYAGFFVFNNVIRPVRLAGAVAVSPQFDKFIAQLQEKMKISKGLAILVTVLLANVVCTVALMCGGIALASVLAGVPVFPPKA